MNFLVLFGVLYVFHSLSTEFDKSAAISLFLHKFLLLNHFNPIETKQQQKHRKKNSSFNTVKCSGTVIACKTFLSNTYNVGEERLIE